MSTAAKLPICPLKIAQAGPRARDTFALIHDMPRSRHYSFSWTSTLQDIVTLPTARTTG